MSTSRSAAFFCGMMMFAVCSYAAKPTPATPKPATDKKAVDAKALPKIYTTQETAEFIKLAKETLAAQSAGKDAEVITKITDLETAWDDNEKTMKPKDEATWTSIDKSLDKGISALRSSKKNPAAGKAALEEMIKKLEQTTLA